MNPILILPQSSPECLLFYTSLAACGFTGLAAGYLRETLSLDQLLICHPAATFFVRVRGTTEGVGIFDGDTLIIDQLLNPRDGDVILTLPDGELIVKRLIHRNHRNNKPELHSENPDYPPVTLDSEQKINVRDVITEVIHHLR